MATIRINISEALGESLVPHLVPVIDERIQAMVEATISAAARVADDMAAQARRGEFNGSAADCAEEIGNRIRNIEQVRLE